MTFTTKLIATGALLARAGASFSHEGHGLAGGSHWHASDTWGLLMVASLAALAIWLSRGGK